MFCPQDKCIHYSNSTKYGKKCYYSPQCLPSGTKIMTMVSKLNQYSSYYQILPKNIENIVVGDIVLSYNEKLGIKELKKVTELFSYIAEELTLIKFSNGNKLKCTLNHPIATINSNGRIEWILACNLKARDKCIQYIYTGLTLRLSQLDKKGKNYTNIYGEKKAKKLVNLLSKRQKEIGNAPPTRLGNYDELYGVRADEMRLKRKSEAIKRCSDPKYIDKLKRTDKSYMKSPEYIKRYVKGQHIRPTKPERKVINILESIIPKEFEYNGGYERGVSFDGLIPDFINVNGKKKVIEVLGDYWHSKKITGRTVSQEEQYLHKRYAKYKVDCLCIWESELASTNNITNKILSFIYNPNTVAIEITDTKTIYENRRVYNFEVADNHNYFAYGILVHNCWRGYLDVLLFIIRMKFRK